MSNDHDNRDSLKQTLFEMIPIDGTSKGNMTLKAEFSKAALSKYAVDLADDDYWNLRDALIDEGRISIGRGRGGSVRR